jgi:hypothetical protein
MNVNRRDPPRRYHSHSKLIRLGEDFQSRFVELVLLYVRLDVIKVFWA